MISRLVEFFDIMEKLLYTEVFIILLEIFCSGCSLCSYVVNIRENLCTPKIVYESTTMCTKELCIIVQKNTFRVKNISGNIFRKLFNHRVTYLPMYLKECNYICVHVCVSYYDYSTECSFNFVFYLKIL